MIVYYAHCIAIYGTAQEREDIRTLQGMGMSVLNPSDSKYDSHWKSDGMGYADILINRVDVLAFRRLPNGKIPAGVGYEIRKAKELGMPIVELPFIDYKDIISREETRAYIHKMRG